MSEASLESLLGPEGPLAGRLTRLELRPSQIQMAEAVDATLAEGGRLLVEAGPGTGKTFAYLIPALRRARLPDRRVVVSTWTRTLQEQIEDKDLPLLAAAFDTDVEVAFLQGRGNYVCRRRASESLLSRARRQDPDAAQRQLEQIVRWSETSRDGLRGRLGFEPRSDVWAAARAEPGNCLRRSSPFFRSCSWQWAKRRARDAAVLVVNHALLLADLKLRRSGGAVLPDYAVLIIDEAHHLEELAAQHLGVRVSEVGLRAVLARASRTVESRPSAEAAHAAERRVQSQARQCRALSVEFLQEALGWLGSRQSAVLPDTAALQTEFPLQLLQLQDALTERSRHAQSESARLEYTLRADQCQVLAEELVQVLSSSDPDSVAYLEREGGQGSVALCTAPIEPGSVLAAELFAPLHAVVLTSATLAVPGARDPFAFVRRGTGLHEARSLCLPSPFDFERQAVVVLDPLPDPRDEDAYLQALVERIPVHVARTLGRAFVLFTSRRTMEAVAEGARNAIEELGVELLVQGRRMPRSDLLQRFRDGQPAVLFGLASFWEGVDVAGPELSHVVLTRLPFAVPGHPRDVARAERLQAAGLDPFRDRSLPESVLRFKQGFGRLIRTRDDEGFVTILDSRVLRRGYGRLFLNALPECPRVLIQDGEEIPLPVDDEETGSLEE